MDHRPFYNLFFVLLMINVISLNAQSMKSNSIKNKAKKNWINTVENNIIPISNIESDNFEDLMFLKDYIKEKRIVFLGESLHGIDNFNVLKFRIIRFLHQEMGFNVVAFESGEYECGMVNLIKDSLTPPEILSHSLKVIWWVKSNCEMMNYFKNNHLSIAGLDPNNVTSPLNKNSYYNIFEENSILAENLFAIDTAWFNYSIQRSKYFFEKKSSKITMNSLDSNNSFLTTNYLSFKKTISEDTNLRSDLKTMLKRLIESKIQELNTTNIKENEESFYVTYHRRDSLMAKSLEFIVDSIYSNQKVIVWAHNAHISKDGLDKYVNKGVSLGTFLDDRLKKISYVIGFHGWGGSYSIGYESYKFKKLVRNSLEAILFSIPKDNFFLPISSFDFNLKENNWLSSPLYEFNSGKHNILKDKYDAIFFSKKNNSTKLINYTKIEFCE